MGCRIIEGREEGCTDTKAVFFCSTTGVAFGPVMESADEAEEFSKWLEGHPTRRVRTNLRRGRLALFDLVDQLTADPRAYGDRELMELYARFRRERETVEVPLDNPESDLGIDPGDRLGAFRND